MKESDFNIGSSNITIVGMGLIGGSIAMAIKELEPKNLWAIDINKDIINSAKMMGIIDEGYLEASIPLKKSDIVILCVYPELTIKFIRDNINHFKSGAIITDTSGLKLNIVDEVNSIIREDIDFIGAHPMAGKEYKGLEFSSKDIFIDANYIITPTDNNKIENISILEKIITNIGCKNIVKVNAKKHDEIIAFTSQLPHILAMALINCETDENINLYTAGSFKDATRVANMNSELWSELFINNSENVINKISSFEEQLLLIKSYISNKDKESISLIIETGKAKLVNA